MDMERALADYQIDSAIKQLDEAKFKLILVAPASIELPDDGFLHYAVAADVAALIACKDGGVLLFNESSSKLLRMFVEYQDEFGVRVKVLEGLPNSEYAPWFNSLVWSQDKASYSGILSEMSIAMSAEETERVSTMSAHDRERAQYTRADGNVKAQANFSVAGEEDEGEVLDQ